MKHYLVLLVCALVATVAAFFVCVLFATLVEGKEPTSLDEAIERPVRIIRVVDKELGTVCYYNERHPQYLNCVARERANSNRIDAYREIIVK